MSFIIAAIIKKPFLYHQYRLLTGQTFHVLFHGNSSRFPWQLSTTLNRDICWWGKHNNQRAFIVMQYPPDNLSSNNCFPHSAIYLTIGNIDCPTGVSEYSTRGGTTGYTSRFIIPSYSNSRAVWVNILFDPPTFYVANLMNVKLHFATYKSLWFSTCRLFCQEQGQAYKNILSHEKIFFRIVLFFHNLLLLVTI